MVFFATQCHKIDSFERQLASKECVLKSIHLNSHTFVTFSPKSEVTCRALGSTTERLILSCFFFPLGFHLQTQNLETNCTVLAQVAQARDMTISTAA